MPTFLFDLIVRGLVDADNSSNAEAALEHIAQDIQGTHNIYVDEIADVTVMILPRQPCQKATMPIGGALPLDGAASVTN